jgi:hypothetical protein
MGVYESWMRDLERDLGLGMADMAGTVAISPAATRTDVIKAVWSTAQTEDHVYLSLNRTQQVQVFPTNEVLTFELIRYGDMWCVECEGVIVQRTPINP